MTRMLTEYGGGGSVFCSLKLTINYNLLFSDGYTHVIIIKGTIKVTTDSM